MINYNININNLQIENVVINNYGDDYNRETDTKDKKFEDEFKDKTEEEVLDEDKIIEYVDDVILKFEPKKQQNVIIADSFDLFGSRNKATRLKTCMTYLEFMKYGENLKLIYSNSCHVRLCPLCAWRRSLKVYRDTRVVFDEIKKSYKGSRFLFLTLTCKNVKGEELSETITKMLYAFKMMFKYKAFKEFVLGFMRSLEVTYNQEDEEFHPHIHVLIHTSFNLYSGRNYLTHSDFVGYWANALGIDYEPFVNIKSFKSKNRGQEGKELAEICKYCVKYSDMIIEDDIDKTSEILYFLECSLANRRLLGFGGTLKETMKKIKIKPDNDFSDEDELSDGEEDEGYKVIYKWHFGENKYIKRVGC